MSKYLSALSIDHLHKSAAASLYKKKPVKSSVAASVTGAAIQTPAIPNSAGNVKMQSSRTTSPREDEITADSNAFPIAVK